MVLNHYIRDNDLYFLIGDDFVSKSLLDVGCGSGLSGQSLKKVGFQTFDGVDAAESFMQVSKESGNYRNLSIGKIDETEKLPYEDASYEAVLCAGCISAGHIKSEYGIPEFIRLLKKGGIAVYTIAPMLDFGAVMQDHVPYVQSKAIEIISLEKKFYLNVENNPRYCNIYCIRKL